MGWGGEEKSGEGERGKGVGRKADRSTLCLFGLLFFVAGPSKAITQLN